MSSLLKVYELLVLSLTYKIKRVMMCSVLHIVTLFLWRFKVKDFGHMFKTIDRLFKIRMDKELENLDITLAQMHILYYLEVHRGEKVTPKQISEDFQVKHSTTAGILQRMKDKNLVDITVDPENKKYRNITKTKESDRIKKALIERKNAMESMLLQGFTEEEKLKLSEYLNRIYNNLISDDVILEEWNGSCENK